MHVCLEMYFYNLNNALGAKINCKRSVPDMYLMVSSTILSSAFPF